MVNSLARVAGKRATHPILVVVLAQLIYAVGMALGILLLWPVTLVVPPPSSESMRVVVGFVQVVLMHAPIFCLLWLWLRYYERRPFLSLGITFGPGAWRQHALGFGFGLAFVAGWVALQSLIGNLRVEEWWREPVLLLWLPLAYLTRILMISIEEILYRGWMLQSVSERWGVPAGVAVSSGAFALFHFASPLMILGPMHDFHWVLALNLVLWSVFAALLTLIGRSLWAAFAFHAAPLWLATNVVVAIDGQWQPGWAAVIVSHPKGSPLLGEAAKAAMTTGLPTTALFAALCVGAFLVYRRRIPAA